MLGSGELALQVFALLSDLAPDDGQLCSFRIRWYSSAREEFSSQACPWGISPKTFAWEDEHAARAPTTSLPQVTHSDSEATP